MALLQLAAGWLGSGAVVRQARVRCRCWAGAHCAGCSNSKFTPGPLLSPLTGPRPRSTLGETFDVNEADPLGLLENVFESSALHDAERGGGSAGAERRTHGGDAALAGGSRPGSRGSRSGSAHAQ